MISTVTAAQPVNRHIDTLEKVLLAEAGAGIEWLVVAFQADPKMARRLEDAIGEVSAILLPSQSIPSAAESSAQLDAAAWAIRETDVKGVLLASHSQYFLQANFLAPDPEPVPSGARRLLRNLVQSQDRLNQAQQHLVDQVHEFCARPEVERRTSTETLFVQGLFYVVESGALLAFSPETGSFQSLL